MNLIIDVDNSMDLNKFCEWLCPKILEHAYNTINKDKLSKFNDYINVALKMERKATLDVYSILIGGFNNLVYSRFPSYYIIEIDKNAIIPKTLAKFIDIMKMVNYGTLSIPPYPIVDEIFTYFADNIRDFYKTFLEEV